MEEHFGETRRESDLPVQLSHPIFWAALLPELLVLEGEYPEWVQHLEASSPDDLSGYIYLPDFTLLLPQGYHLVISLSFSRRHRSSEIYYYLRNADLPNGGLIGHNNCHCQLPIFRWSEAQQLAQVLQKANPTLLEGTALLLWPALWLNDPEFEEAKPVILSILHTLNLAPGNELTNPARILHEGQAAYGEMPDVEFEWWELQPGDWVNNSLYSLRSITAFGGTRWDDATRRKFNRVLASLGVGGSSPTP